MSHKTPPANYTVAPLALCAQVNVARDVCFLLNQYCEILRTATRNQAVARRVWGCLPARSLMVFMWILLLLFCLFHGTHVLSTVHVLTEESTCALSWACSVVLPLVWCLLRWMDALFCNIKRAFVVVCCFHILSHPAWPLGGTVRMKSLYPHLIGYDLGQRFKVSLDWLSSLDPERFSA